MSNILGRKNVFHSQDEGSSTWTVRIEVNYRDDSFPVTDPLGKWKTLPAIDVGYNGSRSEDQMVKDAENIARAKLGIPPIP